MPTAEEIVGASMVLLKVGGRGKAGSCPRLEARAGK